MPSKGKLWKYRCGRCGAYFKHAWQRTAHLAVCKGKGK